VNATNYRTDHPCTCEILDDGCGVRLLLPIEPPGCNVYLKRTGHYATRKVRELTKRLAGDAMLGKCVSLHPQMDAVRDRRSVHVVTVRRRLLSDDPNINGCLKPVIDALTERKIGRDKVSGIGLIRDDSRRWADVECSQRKCVKGESPHVEITVESKEANP
jgi:hypothetical protein